MALHDSMPFVPLQLMPAAMWHKYVRARATIVIAHVWDEHDSLVYDSYISTQIQSISINKVVRGFMYTSIHSLWVVLHTCVWLNTCFQQWAFKIYQIGVGSTSERITYT